MIDSWNHRNLHSPVAAACNGAAEAMAMTPERHMSWEKSIFFFFDTKKFYSKKCFVSIDLAIG